MNQKVKKVFRDRPFSLTNVFSFSNIEIGSQPAPSKT